MPILQSYDEPKVSFIDLLFLLPCRISGEQLGSLPSEAGCRAVFITVDCAVLGRRLNEAKNDFRLPTHIELPNLPEDLDWRALDSTDDRLKFDAALSWKTLVEWAKQSTKMQIWLKGGKLPSSQ